MIFAQCLERMCGLSLTCKLKTQTWSSLKYFEVLVKIMVGGMDVDVGLIVNSRHCVSWMHMRFQMVMKGNFSSLLKLDFETRVCLGWDKHPPMVMLSLTRG